MPLPRTFELRNFPEDHVVDTMTAFPEHGYIRFNMRPGKIRHMLDHIDVHFTSNGRGLLIRGGSSLAIEPHVSNVLAVSLKDYT